MTAQIHDHIVVDGSRRALICGPEVPDAHPRIVARDEGALDNALDRLARSTACWRGQIAEWEIRGDRLYLTGVRGRVRLVGGTPLFADWFSGEVIVSDGDVLHYVHMAFETIFEREIHLEVEAGVVRQRTLLDNREEAED